MISSSLAFGLLAALIALCLLIAYRAGRLRDQHAIGRPTRCRDGPVVGFHFRFWARV
jgi:hypothetical protein